MLKLFLASLITLSINLGTIQQSKAAIGGVVALVGVQATGVKIALTGLGILVGSTGLAYGAYAVTGDEEYGYILMITWPLFLILLDEDDKYQLDLSKVKKDSMIKAGLNPNEQKALVANREELETVFNEAMKDRHVDLAAARFEEAKAILGEDAITGLHKLLTTEI